MPFHHEQNWTILNSSWCIQLIVSLKWNMACPRRFHSPSCFLCWKAATTAHGKGRRPIFPPPRWLPDYYSSIFMCDYQLIPCSFHQLCLNRSHRHFANSLPTTPICHFPEWFDHFTLCQWLFQYSGLSGSWQFSYLMTSSLPFQSFSLLVVTQILWSLRNFLTLKSETIKISYFPLWQ